MDKEEEVKKILNFINRFRKSPSIAVPQIKNYLIALERIDVNSKQIKIFKELRNKCKDIYGKKNPLRLSPTLSECATKYISEHIEQSEEILLKNNELSAIIPKQFKKKNALLFFDPNYDTEMSFIIKLVSKLEISNFKNNFVLSDKIIQVGISVDEQEENTYACLIFEEEEEDEFTIENVDLSELKKAFDVLDFENKNQIKIKEVLESMKQSGKDKSDPTIYDLFVELDNGNEYISWKEFAIHFYSKMSDLKNEKGIKIIFDIFKNHPNDELIDYCQLKQINEYLNLNYTDNEIQDMIKNCTKTKIGLNFNDFCDFIKMNSS